MPTEDLAPNSDTQEAQPDAAATSAQTTKTKAKATGDMLLYVCSSNVAVGKLINLPHQDECSQTHTKLGERRTAGVSHCLAPHLQSRLSAKSRQGVRRSHQHCQWLFCQVPLEVTCNCRITWPSDTRRQDTVPRGEGPKRSNH